MTSIYEYSEYRKFIQDTISVNKVYGRGLSLSQLAHRGGIKSKALISLVCAGKRNLSIKTIPQFSKMLGLKSKEADYFENLVFFNQAKVCEEQLKYHTRLKELAKTTPVKPMGLERFDLWSQWYTIILREMVELIDFSEDAQWVIRRLKERLTPTQIKNSFTLLEEAGLLKREGKKLVQSEPKITTGDELRSKALRQFHYEMLNQAKKALDQDQDLRETSGLTIALSDEEFKEIKQRIIEFRKTLNQIYGQENRGNKNHVYHIALTCFQVTKNGMD